MRIQDEGPGTHALFPRYGSVAQHFVTVHVLPVP